MVKIAKNGQNRQKWSKMVKNGQNGQNGLKWSKLVPNDPKWFKMSARRVQRTKSSRPEGLKAGPKGRKLEVRARRAPRLLVEIYYHKTHIKQTHGNLFVTQSRVNIKAVMLHIRHM